MKSNSSHLRWQGRFEAEFSVPNGGTIGFSFPNLEKALERAVGLHQDDA